MIKLGCYTLLKFFIHYALIIFFPYSIPPSQLCVFCPSIFPTKEIKSNKKKQRQEMPKHDKKDTENMESILCCPTPRSRPDLEWSDMTCPMSLHLSKRIVIFPSGISCK